MNNLIIYQRVLPHYRVPFFDTVYSKLLKYGINLLVVAGFEQEGQVPKTILISRPWLEYRENIYFSVFQKELVIQKFKLKDCFADAVIVEQSNRLLLNYIIIVLRFLGIFKVGLWGHGRNFQSSKPSGLKERFKKNVSQFYDWWFCYTERGSAILSHKGIPSNRITIVKNSIDLKEFECLSKVNRNEVQNFGSISIRPGDNIAIYCGGIYKEKRIDFLLDTLSNVRLKVPNFKFILIGDGPEVDKVKAFSKENCNWFYWAGEQSGKERAYFFLHAKAFLMPGLVGLAVLDSFASEVPMITTDISYHSPEIDYLINGYNGLIVEDDIEKYSDAIVKVMLNTDYYTQLKMGCSQSKLEFSIDNMALNYSNGILGLLSQ